MRFGKRNRGRLIPPQREGESIGNVGLGPVARDERNALLYGVEDDGIQLGEAVVSGTSAGQPSGGDPTQRMLTALGRFHRFVDKGHGGAPQANWSDDCMSQLGVAIEVSFEQDWANLVEALTDTARVLQSYENAGAAESCIPFLNDSYEILCLMVGDIIVDNMRSDVMERWRTRYRGALQELQMAGIALVQDEDEEVEAPADVPDSNVIPFELPSARTASPMTEDAKETPSLDSYLPFLRAADEDEEEVADGTPPVFEPVAAAPVLEEPMAAEPASAAAISASADFEPVATAEPSSVASMSTDALREYTALDRALEELLPVDPLGAPHETHQDEPVSAGPPLERVVFEDDAVEPEEEYEPSPLVTSVKAPAPVSAAPEPRGEDAVTLALLDSLSEDLACIEQAPDADHGARWDAMREKVGSLATRAKETGLESAGAICATMSELCLAASRRRVGGIEGFVDTAYLFCEAYVQADRNPDSVVVANWRSESGSLLGAWTAPPQPGDPTDHLLETARSAMARGDLSGAKALALQAVAQMAKGEAARAEARVQEAELRLKQSAEAIEQSRSAVARAEQEVVIAEGRVSEGESALVEAQSVVQTTQEQSSEAMQRIAAIDEEIRRLQERRAEEEEQAHQIDATLRKATDDEASTSEELDALRQSEETARTRLEDARQTVKDHQRRRAEIETALLRSRETLTRHRASLSDIERAVGQSDDPQESPRQDSNGLLFD